MTRAPEDPKKAPSAGEPRRDEPQVFDLEGVDVDSTSILAWVARLREAAGAGPVVVKHCPQLLAHTLYKAALLGGAIVLESVRDEEPYG
ncbi:MAG TPA: hypothetical protein VIK91_13765 [Nannocystis sp.]